MHRQRPHGHRHPPGATGAGHAARPDTIVRMSIRIYHNPACGTSRTVLALIREAGVEPQIINYLETPPDRETLTGLIAAMGIRPRQLLRRKAEPYATLGLDDPKWSDEQLVALMLEHPILIERPVVVSPLGTRLCRPAETVLEILPPR